MTWFQKNARDLPWRRNRSPYKSWISEMMLQQTQVKTMVPYFDRWMKVFPDIQTLAQATEERVLKLWEGLGYYSRARNILKAASYIYKEQGGQIPSRYEELIRVPGIGPYSAGAILSIAFNQKVPIVDGNVIRVISRLFAITDPVDSQKIKKKIWSLETELLPDRNPGVFNEALMELGALVCSKNDPDCPSCPLAQSCQAFKKNLTGRIPNKRFKIKIQKVSACALLVERGGKYFIHRRPTGQLMGGLWEFPEWKIETQDKPLSEIRRFAALRSRLEAGELVFLRTLKRHYTKYNENLHVFGAKLKPSETLRTERRWSGRWLNRGELSRLPFTSAHRKVFDLIAD